MIKHAVIKYAQGSLNNSLLQLDETFSIEYIQIPMGIHLILLYGEGTKHKPHTLEYNVFE